MNAARLRSWLPLVLALAWVTLIRIPLVLNAETHLDSDLAVDGLTLADAVRGHLRWHYPGTPAIGTPPVLASLPMALVWGANPRTLVSGGVVLVGLVLIATYVLNRRVHGPSVAAWGLVPLTFGSTGLIWLSGRITGGHLLVVAWSAIAFLLLYRWLTRGGIGSALGMGLWCGLGLYVDRMFLLALVSCVLAGVATRGSTRISARQYDAFLAFVVGTLIGYVPHWVGAWLDPHDAYGEQFVSIFRPIGGNATTFGLALDQAGDLLVQHGRILALECLPRLVSGHRLPGLEIEPLAAGSVAGPIARAVFAAWTLLALATFAVSIVAVGVLGLRSAEHPPRRAIATGLLALAALVVAGFLFNRNIFNSDNYRYLVLLILPGSTGFGLAFTRLRRVGWLPARGLALALAGLATADAWLWYRGLGWVEGARPVVVRRNEPALQWLRDHPEVDEIHARYWEVYRLAFLSGRPLRAWPWPDEPQRFGPPPERTPPDVTAVVLLTPGGRMNEVQGESLRLHADGLLLWGPGRLTVYRWR
jgi:hypothetical protein